ncbi:MAG TPA: hypothetical protein VGP80_09815 [Gemmatimonadales bacterium]|jgi:hypothetical protein|nr:hypothetical protein [Gemmatimonadales bacterium]
MRVFTALALSLAITACKKAEMADNQAWQVSIRGYGPIQAGMTLAQAAEAGKRPLTAINPGSEECDYVRFEGDSSRGIQFMVVQGRIARVDVHDTTISTSHGIRIGDSEATVQEKYAERVTVSPHKYGDGHYLVVAPATPADSGHEIVFETEGARVTTYRSGRVPEVEYVEGCS